MNLFNNKIYKRRAFLKGTILTTGSFLLTSCSGGRVTIGNTRYSPSVYRYLLKQEVQKISNAYNPILSQSTIRNSKAAIARLERIVRKGGWGGVFRQMREGDYNPEVVMLRKRLAESGDIVSEETVSPEYDKIVVLGVARFQIRHGLSITGRVDQRTLMALNVSANVRLLQLKYSIQRLHKLLSNINNHSRIIFVNIPSVQIDVIEKGKLIQRHRGIVGRPERPTPRLITRVKEVNVNPYWHVPTSIVYKDLIPEMQKNPKYMREHKIFAYSDNYKTKVPEDTINWFSDEPKKYLYRQDPGSLNALGYLRINIPNRFSVFMHDTPNQLSFSLENKYRSSGCVRVQGIRKLTAWILSGNAGWNLDRIEQAILDGKTLTISPELKHKVILGYINAWATENGALHFREDVYGLDTHDIQALGPNATPGLIHDDIVEP